MQDDSLLGYIYDRGHGVISVGRGWTVIFSESLDAKAEAGEDPKTGHGCAFLNPQEFITFEEFEAAFEETKRMIDEAIRNAPNKDKKVVEVTMQE